MCWFAAQVTRREFRLLLEGLCYFNSVWDRFQSLDADGDRRLSKDEFVSGCVVMGVDIARSEAELEFAEMDENGGGYVLFDEFCAWCARRACGPEAEEGDGEGEAKPAAGGGEDVAPERGAM